MLLINVLRYTLCSNPVINPVKYCTNIHIIDYQCVIFGFCCENAVLQGSHFCTDINNI